MGGAHAKCDNDVRSKDIITDISAGHIKPGDNAVLLYINPLTCQTAVALALVVPFVGPDGIISKLWWTSTDLHLCIKMQGGLADNFFLSINRRIFQ